MKIFSQLKALKFLSTSGPIKLHLGCGRNIKDGWINIDHAKTFRNKSKLDIVHNLVKGIPFPDASVDYIFHEHLIEHLDRDDGVAFSRECRRVLKNGGVLRIAYPDIDDAIADYQADYANYEWYYQIYPKRRGLTNSEIFNLDMREGGEHRHLYNERDIARMLVQAGFDAANISMHKVFESPHAELVKIEKRANSRCVEAIKKS